MIDGLLYVHAVELYWISRIGLPELDMLNYTSNNLLDVKNYKKVRMLVVSVLQFLWNRSIPNLYFS